MSFNLQLTYWILISVSIISSCFLFFVVASENAELIAAAATTVSSSSGSKVHTAPGSSQEQLLAQIQDSGTFSNFQSEKFSSSSLDGDAEQILPSCGHVGDRRNIDNDIHRSEASSPESDSESSLCSEIKSRQATTKSQYQQQSPLSDVVVVPIEGEGDGGLIIDEVLEAADPTLNNDVLPKIDERIDENSAAEKERLPDMMENNPSVLTLNEITSTELPVDVRDQQQQSVDSVVVTTTTMPTVVDVIENNSNTDETENATTNDEIQKDDEMEKINDSGGGTIPPQPPDDVVHDIKQENASSFDTATATTTTSTSTTTTIPTTTTTTNPDVNLTAEEVPIPVFSEWAQKQMEADEKKLEQEVVNSSAHKKNATTGGTKPPTLKLRTKNYASPDCGAKIIASNSDAQNTAALLASSKDEYMLSPCTNRIWFVVELCEAIQAEKIDLANFELFSSSPKNFTVAVSNRFPTREWSNVGRFIADDKRNIQSFDLHPHLFGKFVRVDIHSHYNSEHFCPVSLFRVYGTSEFEAFETENRLVDDIDEYDDEFPFDSQTHENNNLFKSASDAVLSIVKKAAEVLVKTNSNRTTTDVLLPTGGGVGGIGGAETLCFTPTTGEFLCPDCNNSLVTKVNHVLSCRHFQLLNLLAVDRLRSDILASQICAKQFSIEPAEIVANIMMSPTSSPSSRLSNVMINAKQSYFLSLLPDDYVGAMCQLLVGQQHTALKKSKNDSTMPAAAVDRVVGGEGRRDNEDEVTLNLTIDKKTNSAGGVNNFESLDRGSKRPIHASRDDEINLSRHKLQKFDDDHDDAVSSSSLSDSSLTSSAAAAANSDDLDEQIPRPPQLSSGEDETTAPSLSLSSDERSSQAHHGTSSTAATQPALDVNIYNLPEAQQLDININTKQKQMEDAETAIPAVTVSSSSPQEVYSNVELPIGSDGSGSETMPSHGKPTESLQKPSSDDASSWDSLDNLLSEQVAAAAATHPSVSTSTPSSTNHHQHQKVPSGPHSESVFIRLSNRIKALERNMSLSGQYLEELSRRYKKQVEELQQSLTKTVRALEEQNRRHSEHEQDLHERNVQLKNQLDDLSLQVQACVVLIICVGAFLFLIAIFTYHAIRRQTAAPQQQKQQQQRRRSSAEKRKSTQKTLSRRKSFEDFSDHKSTMTKAKVRRPSEEAMLILKECAECGVETTSSSNCEEVEKRGEGAGGDLPAIETLPKQRLRKISVCYGVNNNNNSSSINAINLNSKRNKRKIEKKVRTSMDHHHHHHHNPSEHSEEYHTHSGEEPPQLPLQTCNNAAIANNKNFAYKRHASAPECCCSVNSCNALKQNSLPLPTPLNDNDAVVVLVSTFDEKLLLDDDDIVNFIPGTDLAYNEFMPDGPSGYKNASDDKAERTAAASIEKSSSSAINKQKTTRRLSSPAFFKAIFSKSSKSKTTPPHQSTSWEWYRSRKSEESLKQQQQRKQRQQTAAQENAVTTSVTSSSAASSPTAMTVTSHHQQQLKIVNGTRTSSVISKNSNCNSNSSSNSNSSNISSSTSSSLLKGN